MIYKTMMDVRGYLVKILDSVAGIPVDDFCDKYLPTTIDSLGKSAVVGITYKAKLNADHASLDILLNIAVADGGYTVTSWLDKD